MATSTPAKPTKTRGARWRAAVFGIVGRWWVGPVALILVVVMLNSRVWWYPRGLSGTLQVLVPDSAKNGEPRVVTLDGSWDDLSPYYLGELGALYDIDWGMMIQRTGWPTPWKQARKCWWSVRFVGNRESYLRARGLPADVGPIRLDTIGEKGKAAALAAFDKISQRAGASGGWEHVRLLVGAMRGGPDQDVRVLWPRVAIGWAGIMATPLLALWLVWLMSEVVGAWTGQRRRSRLARGTCPRCLYPLDTRAIGEGTWLCPECGAKGERRGGALATPAAAGRSS